MDQPLVSVILLCYNHGLYVKEAIDSVLTQTYPAIQLIVVDDASGDNSVAVIDGITKDKPGINFLRLGENLGNCKAFNKGLAVANGEFIIDLAGDDTFEPTRVQKQVDFFATLDKSYGVIFTDAVYVDGQGGFLYNHYENLFKKKLLTSIPRGDVYIDVLYKYFIASPTMMVKRVVFDALGGYDEALAYEDFDFWVRSSRTYKYAFLDEKLTRIRRLKNSMSSGWYKLGDKQLHSTYRICEKAKLLNRNVAENDALRKRVHYELRQSVFSENRVEAKLFYGLLKDLSGARFVDTLTFYFGKLNLPLSVFRRMYHKIFFESV